MFVRFAILVLALGVLGASAQTQTTFTYQGRLDVQGEPYTGTADYRFSLFGSAQGGPLLAPASMVAGLVVDDGVFTTEIDFGPEPHGPGRFLEIAVRTPAWDGFGVEPEFSVFPQRTPLTPAPHALSTRGLSVNDAGRAAVGGEPGLPQFSVLSGDNDLGLLVQSASPTATRLQLSNTTPGGQFWSLNSNGVDAIAPGSLSLRRGSSLQSDSTALTITPDRDIGIRTSSPTQTLDVNGTVRVRREMTVEGGLDIQSFLTSRSSISADGPITGQVIVGRSAVFAAGGPPDDDNLIQRGFAFLGNGGSRDSGLFSLGDRQVSLFANAFERVRIDERNIAIGAGFAPLNNIHIRHQNVGAGWGIRIQTEAQSAFQTGIRVSNDGFFDISNNIGGSNFARLTSSGVWTTISDERTKEDIHHLENALDRAMRLDPVAYRYKGTDTEEIGFTAQNVAAEFPSLVTRGDDLMTLNYSGLSTVAIAALQELKAEKDREIAELRRMNAEFAAELARMRRQLAGG